jgi:S1-C subfamily serine protease
MSARESAHRRAAAIGGVALLLAACGGEPPPKAPVAPPPAPAPPPKVDHDAACNELLIGAGALSALVKTETGSYSAAGRLYRARSAAAYLTQFRDQLKAGVALDGSLADDADKVDKAVAPLVPRFENESKIIESHANTLREIVNYTEGLKSAFAVTGACGKKDAECENKRRASMLLDRIVWSPMMLDMTRTTFAAYSFATPELEAKKTQIIAKLAEAASQITDEDKAIEAIYPPAEPKDAKADPKAESKGEWAQLGKLADALYDKCGIKEQDWGKSDFAMHKPAWVTSDAPDLRKMTMVVRVLPEGRIKTKLEDWADNAIGSVAAAYEGASRGGFGSGFFVMPRPGDLYIVTNRHVVDFGDHATLMMQDGTAITGEILYVDPDADLAVLRPKPPKDKPLDVTYGLGLDATMAKDQQVVIATGYPGLAARPSYQTTRGYVSNQRFVDPWDHNTYIQHTAPIDKGGSGGPLTSEKSLVLGVNTLKITDREAVGMSVPASQVLDAVNHAMRPTPDAETLRKEAAAACMQTLAIATGFGKTDELYQRISLGMVAETGAAAYNAVKDKQLEELLYESPIDALRSAVAMKMQRDARVGHLNPFEICQSPDPDDMEHILTMDRVRFHMHAGAETKDLVLHREFGVFRVLRFDILPPPKDEPFTLTKPAKKKPPAKKK